ncbi:MAG: hypothetical protein ACOYOB_12940 [Myxococcota bacterium]
MCTNAHRFGSRCYTSATTDRWVDAAAITTLMLIASPRSSAVLREALEFNPGQRQPIRAELATPPRPKGNGE